MAAITENDYFILSTILGTRDKLSGTKSDMVLDLYSPCSREEQDWGRKSATDAMNHSKDLLADEKYYRTKEGIGQDDTGEVATRGNGRGLLPCLQHHRR